MEGEDGMLFCESSDDKDDTLEDFCSDSRARAYLRVYALLLGDFELDSYKATPGMTVLFFVFTICGVIILLNVLIALTSDSYEKASIKGDHLFGRARVTFVSQNEALESFLRPGKAPLDNIDTARKALVRGIYFARWAVLVLLIGTTFNAEFFLCHRAWVAATKSDLGFFVFTSILLAVLLSVGIWILCGKWVNLHPTGALNQNSHLRFFHRICASGRC